MVVVCACASALQCFRCSAVAGSEVVAVSECNEVFVVLVAVLDCWCLDLRLPVLFEKLGDMHSSTS